MDYFLDVFCAVFPGMPARSFDDASFQKRDLVCLDELDGLDGQRLVMVAADLGF